MRKKREKHTHTLHTCDSSTDRLLIVMFFPSKQRTISIGGGVFIQFGREKKKNSFEVLLIVEANVVYVIIVMFGLWVLYCGHINQGEAYNYDSYPPVGGDAGDGPSATIPRIVIRVSLNLLEVGPGRGKAKHSHSVAQLRTRPTRPLHSTLPFLEPPAS
jgi:hypothetical protein